MTEKRAGRARQVRDWLLGAPPTEPRTLADALELAEGAPELQRLRQAEPQQFVRVERLHTAAQGAFQQSTRDSVRRALEQVVRVAIREAAAQGPGNGLGAGRLRDEADSAAQRLRADAARAAGLGLNIGLACGILLSPVILVLVLALGQAVPSMLGHRLGCPEQLSLLYALVCFSGGAMGATLSVIVRLRDSDQLLPHARDGQPQPDIPADPLQLSQFMRLEGWYRVVVGWFLATSLFLLINGGILTLLTPPAAPEGLCGSEPLSLTGHQELIRTWFFWGSVGFLAGLNERWAYGLLRRSSGQHAPARP